MENWKFSIPRTGPVGGCPENRACFYGLYSGPIHKSSNFKPDWSTPLDGIIKIYADVTFLHDGIGFVFRNHQANPIRAFASAKVGKAAAIRSALKAQRPHESTS
ncbi:hypothetical protein NE237_025941 [Protea cynaroides]|uniref:Uncharacterized protein n=1 Tax=Protea cynaroides TaxID=273540 RepID=A0A9Q0H3Z5_9MAGN|nr:hypothetical protein NE237_025941 [Protea cynaroides]